MEDVPQPKSEPYALGDRVQIYLSAADPDAAHHETECIVVDRFEDELPQDSGRELDAYTYRLRPVDDDTPLSVEFRHFDLCFTPHSE
jgi:hypothetical protein